MPRNPPRPNAAEASRLIDQLYEDISHGRLDIASAVRKMRHISGLNQPEFARHRGISVQTLRKIESGKGNPTEQTLNQIASVFGLKTGFVPKPPKP